MSKNPSNERHMPDEEEERQREMSRTERDRNPQQDKGQRRNSMAEMQKGQKFTSDEDIVRRRTA